MAYRMPTPDPYPGGPDPSRRNVHPHPDPSVVEHPGLQEVQNRRGLLLALAVKRAEMAAQQGQEVGAGTAQRLQHLHSPLAGSLLEGRAPEAETNTLLSFLTKAIGRPRGQGASRYQGLF